MKMKKIGFMLFLMNIALCAFSYKSVQNGFYCNSKEGLNIRKEPNLNSEKIGKLKYGEFVSLAQVGNLVKIDGIEARWMKIVIDYDGLDADDDYRNCGWVFGGYLQAECPMSEKQIIEYLKKAGEEEYFHVEYFPENPLTNYFGDRDSLWVENYHDEWLKIEPTTFSLALPNYCSEYFANSCHKEVVAVRDCYLYYMPVAAAAYGSLKYVKPGEKFKIERVVTWGIEGGTLFPIYEIESGHAYIRGIDVTSADCVSKAYDGKKNFHSLVYQPVLKNVSSEDIGNSRDKIEKAFDGTFLYEGAELKGGMGSNLTIYTDPTGKSYNVYLDTTGALKILYPLKLRNPVPIIQESSFYGGMGGGHFSEKLYSIELRQSDVKLHDVCEYGYTSADVGYDGFAYHFFCDTGVFVYQYQTAEDGEVLDNRTYFYNQSRVNYLDFSDMSDGWSGVYGSYGHWGEPYGDHVNYFAKGRYYNPICRLKLRTSPSLNANKICTLDGGTLLVAVEVGKEEVIDDYLSNWVKVQVVNKSYSIEGSEITQTGWVFGAYLE